MLVISSYTMINLTIAPFCWYDDDNGVKLIDTYQIGGSNVTRNLGALYTVAMKQLNSIILTPITLNVSGHQSNITR